MRSTRGALVTLLLSLIGIAVSGFLFYLHLGLMRGELLGGAACRAAGAFNCYAVTAGPWGTFLGVPLALWGLVGYIVVFALSLLGRQSQEWAVHALTLILLLAAIFVGVDLVLLAIMALAIRYYCLLCLTTYGVNLILLVISARAVDYPVSQFPWRIGRALGALVPSRERAAAALFWGIVFIGVVSVAGLHVSSIFVARGTLRGARNQIREFLDKQPRVNIDVTGDPTIGRPDAPIQVVEFSDFLCPACQRASRLNTVMFAGHRQEVVFAFKNYPLDTTCNEKVGRMVHPGACQVAAAAECLHQQGKFWAFHDIVFEKGHSYKVDSIEPDVAKIGADLQQFRACMQSGQGLEAVRRDIAEGVQIGVTSTPTYVINGISVSGGVNPAIFEDFVAVLRENRR